MNWLLRNFTRLYGGMWALTAVVFLLAPGPARAGAVSCCILAAAAFYVLGGRRLSRAAGRGLVEFYRDCDPVPLLENCDHWLRRAGERCAEGGVLSLRADRAACLLALGRLEEAEEELNRLSAALSGKKTSTTAVVCRGDRIALALDRGRLQGLEGEIEGVRAMLVRVRVPSQFAGLSFPELMEWCLEGYSCRLLLGTAGPVPQLAVRLRALLERAPCTLYQVQAAARLAEYHLARGEEASALPCLRLAARTGGRLACALWAGDKLSRMGEE